MGQAIEIKLTDKQWEELRAIVARPSESAGPRGIGGDRGAHRSTGDVATRGAGTLVAFKAGLEPRLGAGGDLQAIADWGNKLPGALARIAGVLHVGELGSEAALGQPIPGETLRRAAQVGNYAVEHARAAFGLMGADATTALAKHIWARTLHSEDGPVTKHAIHRAMQSRVQRAAELDLALDVLVERGLFREVEAPGPGRPGRPPGPAFEINPRARQ
jgi:hypothetical protein